MTIIGKWKTVKVAVFDENFNMVLKSAEELENTPENAEYLQMLSSIMEFTADGEALTKVKVPDEAMEEAKASGMPIDSEGYCTVDRREWKEEQGNFLYNTGTEGEIMGETVDPFAPLVINEDGSILMPGGMMLLERM